jgi:hypothetical protein
MASIFPSPASDGVHQISDRSFDADTTAIICRALSYVQTSSL